MVADREGVTDIKFSLSNTVPAGAIDLVSVTDNPAVIRVNSLGTLRVTTVNPCGRLVLEVKVASVVGNDRKWSVDRSSGRSELLELDIALDHGRVELGPSPDIMPDKTRSTFNVFVFSAGERLCVDKIEVPGG